MKREPVASPHIASIGYDDIQKILEIEFHKGGIHQYFDVPSHIHSEIMRSTSHGEYHAEHIKGTYRSSKK